MCTYLFKVQFLQFRTFSVSFDVTWHQLFVQKILLSVQSLCSEWHEGEKFGGKASKIGIWKRWSKIATLWLVLFFNWPTNYFLHFIFFIKKAEFKGDMEPKFNFQLISAKAPTETRGEEKLKMCTNFFLRFAQLLLKIKAFSPQEFSALLLPLLLQRLVPRGKW